MADEFRMPTPDPALRRLDFLVGNWNLSGVIKAGWGGRTSGVETFEWLAGGFYLVHRWRAAIYLASTEVIDSGYEFFDFDPTGGCYRSHFFGSFGPYDEKTSIHTGEFDGDALVVVGPSRVTRWRNIDGTITCDSELPDGRGGWTPWIHAVLRRTT